MISGFNSEDVIVSFISNSSGSSSKETSLVMLLFDFSEIIGNILLIVFCDFTVCENFQSATVF